MPRTARTAESYWSDNRRLYSGCTTVTHPGSTAATQLWNPSDSGVTLLVFRMCWSTLSPTTQPRMLTSSVEMSGWTDVSSDIGAMSSDNLRTSACTLYEGDALHTSPVYIAEDLVNYIWQQQYGKDNLYRTPVIVGPGYGAGIVTNDAGTTRHHYIWAEIGD